MRGGGGRWKLEEAPAAAPIDSPHRFLEYAIDAAEACHLLGIRTVAVTAGSICEKPREEFCEHEPLPGNWGSGRRPVRLKDFAA